MPATINQRDRQDLIEALGELLAEKMQSRKAGAELYAGQKHTTPTGTPSTPYVHGPGGLFGVAGLERDVFSTHVRSTGLLSQLPVRGTVSLNPLYPYITGFQDVTGANPTTVCSDGQVVGAIKTCIQTAQLGRYTFMTRELEINRVGQLLNRGEFDDLMLVNDMAFPGSNPFIPNVGEGFQVRARNEMLARMLELGVAFERKMARQLWDANPANNSAGGGYQEFPGLNILIGTNKRDAITNQTCPSLNSDVKNFNYQLVSATTPGNIVNVMTYMYRFLRRTSEQMGFNPTTWAIVMREEAFYEISAVWPCTYLTYRCDTASANTPLQMDPGDIINMRDDMRNGKFLLIDGVRVPVIVDDGIAEQSTATTSLLSAGRFASDVYFIPLTVLGGRAVSFLEYFDYSQGPIAATEQVGAGSFFWTDGGRFLFHSKPPLNWCVQLIAKMEPRVILLTPHLAGRIQNVAYQPLQHTRQPFPTDPYFVDGGVSTPRAVPSLFADWANVQP